MTSSKKRVLIISVVAALIAALAVGIILGIHFNEKRLEEYQNDALAVLEERRGEYNDETIVLSNTSRSEAESFAKKLGAKLRITSNGSFATLTLPEGVTIRDVYADDENRKYLPAFSADYQAKISDRHTETDKRQPTKPGTSSKNELGGYLDYLNLGSVWNKTKGNGVTVAIIDTGIDTDHPEFEGRISEYSYNATEDKIVKDYVLADGSYDWSLIEDEQGHGTSVAGALGASLDGEGVAGVAPEVTFLIIKTQCSDSGVFDSTAELVFGLYYAIERDVSVVNMSFGLDNENPFAEAAALAVDSDVICVAAAGNSATAALKYPAADPNVIGVGALGDDTWELAEYSNYGDNSDVVAPGTTYTAAMGGGYKTTNGTSLASPLVAGAVALLAATDKYITVDEVRTLLYASCYDLGDLGEDWYYGFGAVDVSALVVEERGTITFDMMTDELEDAEGIFIRNHTLQQILEPERYFAVFDGWYYDPYYTEPYNYYEDKFVSDLTLYAKWSGEDDGIPYTYVTLADGTVEIRSYTGRRRFITVPDYIEGKLVTSIGDSAFAGERGLREINLPSGLNNIAQNAFSGCSNLTKIKIPEGVKKIGDNAFESNVRLNTIAFAGSPELTAIGSEAFAHCSSLRRIELPAKLESVDGSAFLGTTSLGAFSVVASNKHFAAEDGVLFNSTKSTLVAYPAGLNANYSLPDSVREIGPNAFAFTKAEQVLLGKVETVGRGAFVSSSLTDVTLPDSVKTLGSEAFARSEQLSVVIIGKGITEIPGRSFYACIMLEEITVPKGVNSIGSAAFASSGLRSVSFADGSRLNSIEKQAFTATSLTELQLPASVISVGEEAFYNVPSLRSVSFGENSNLSVIGMNAFACDYPGSLTSIEIPERLTTLGDFAFSNQAIAGEVKIPKYLSYLGAAAFAFCDELTAFAVDEGNGYYNSVNGVVYTEDGKKLVAYPVGNAATSYTVLDGTEILGASALYSAAKLTEIILPTSLVEIDAYALAYASALTGIAIPDGVMQISNYAFLGDMNMASVSFGANAALPRISYGAFAYCGIKTLTVPKNVSTIAQGAFEGCSKLTSVTFAEGSKLESVSAYMFDGAASLKSIRFLPGSALTSIQAHGFEGMNKLTSIDFGDAELTNIDNFAFRFCESLTSFTVPETVTNIGRYAFYACYGLTSVTIPESVEHIGSFAFLANEELELYFKSETLPLYLDEDWDHGIKGYYLGVSNVTTDGDYKYATLTSGDIAILKYSGTEKNIDLTQLGFGNVTVIGGDAFAFAEIESIILPETLKTIQKEAFFASGLKSVNIPASVEFIGNSAFASTPIEALTFADGSSLKVIEQSAFENTSSLSGSVVIPASVESLGRAVFRDSAAGSVSFADGTQIEIIPEEAFANSGITSFTAPDSVTKIEDGAFRGAKALRSFSYGDGELWLGANAFYTSGLESFHIGKNITMIEEFALTSLDNLTAFTCDADNPYYQVIDGLLTSKDGKKLISVPAGREGSLEVPESIEIIGFGAFERTSLDSVTFAEDANILAIGYRAFFGAEKLSEITIPKSVVSIDYYAFAYCKALENVKFAEGTALTGIYEGAFYGCGKLSDIIIPDSVIEISDFAFYGCSAITKLPVSENSGLRGIYSYAFAYSGLSGELIIPESVIDIGEYAFLGIKAEKVTIPEANARELIIGIGAFEEARELTEITLPFIGASFEDDVITWFGYIFGAGAYEANATYVPESLKVVNINGEITFVGLGAFHGLATLDEISVPESVNTVFYRAFYGTAVKYELSGRISLMKKDYRGNDVISTVADGNYVGKGISGKLELSYGVTSIDQNAFEGCSSLESVIIPDGVTSIGVAAFQLCSGLMSIEIPNSVTSIGTSAFFLCYKLYLVENKSDLPITLDNYSDYGDVTRYAKLLVDKEGNKTYRDETSDFEYIDTADGFRFMKENDTYKLIAYFGNEETVTLPLNINGNNYEIYKLIGVRNVIIPEGVTSIGDSAFSGCSTLTSVVIPNGVTSIGDTAFSGCSTLTSVVIPNGVTSIGVQAFNNCSSLASIVIPEGVTSIESRAFDYCTSLTSIAIPKGVTSIGYCAFEGCASLTSIELPDTVTSIGDFAFLGCTSLTSIKIPTGVTRIGMSAFADTSIVIEVDEGNNNYIVIDNVLYDKSVTQILYVPDSATEITIPKTVTNISGAFNNNTTIQKVVFESGSVITSIGSSAFLGCTGLTSIELPNSVTSIGSSAFLGCTGLTSIELPNSVTTSIGDYAFQRCTSLTSIKISSGITSIGNFAFLGCTSLTSIEIPEGVTRIGDYAFDGCTGLTSIEIPEGVTRIGNGVFSHCTGLTSIDIPNSVSIIGESAFYYCTNLTSIVIHADVRSIGSGAFYMCDYLYIVENQSDLPITLDNYSDYGDVTRYAKILIDKDGNKIYKDETSSIEYIDTADGFLFMKENKTYKLIAYLGDEESVTLPLDINGNTYEIYKMRGVKNVIIPEGVTTIGNYAFSGCTSLTSIEIPEGVTSIGSQAFYGCESLASIDIPEGVTSIGYQAFYGCESLASIKFPDSLTSIGGSVFSNTFYYNDSTNWSDGALYIGNHLIGVKPDVERFEIRAETIAIVTDAFDECYSLKHLTIGRNHSNSLLNLTNLETLFITEMPTHMICSYFGGNAASIPITLKNIVIKSGVRMNKNAFENITGVNIYVEDTERDTQWDVNYPGWNNGNKVLYGDEWISTEFYDNNGNILSSELFSTSQVIRVPYFALEGDVQYSYIVDGFDLDGDGIADPIPATSATDIKAVALVRKVTNNYKVSFMDKDGETPLYTVTLPYGSVITAPENPEKEGYSFIRWSGYKEGMTVTGDIVFYSLWQHEGEGHIYGEAVWVDATCIEGGYNKHTCTVCGEWYATDATEPAGHSYNMTTVAPTCTDEGYDLYSCECGHSYRDNFVAANGHSFGEWVTDSAASCEADGERHHVCFTCGESEYEAIAALGHSYKSELTLEPTCDVGGEITYTCACGKVVIEAIGAAGHSYEQKYVSPDQMSWFEWLIRVLLNIFFGYEGETPYYFECSECGHIATEKEAVTYSFTASVMGTECSHNLGDWTTVTEADCINSAIEGRSCSLCGELVEARIATEPLGHSYDEAVKAPTCTEVGYTSHICSACGDTYYTNLTNPTDHVYTENVTAPTCTEKGYTTHTCDCGDSYVDNYVNAKGHTPGEWTTVLEATHESKGYKQKKCTVCNAILETAEIAALGHNYAANVTAPTCTEKGYTTHTCTCGDSYVDNYVNAKGHTSGEWTTVLEATHESKGYKQKKCTVCGTILETAEIAALGHNHTANVTAPTCENDGYTTYVCSCGDTYVGNIVAATGHSYTASVTAPTCTEKGYTTHTCDCGDSYVDNYVNANGHTSGNWTTVLAATHESKGYKQKKCTACNAILETAEIAAIGHNHTATVTAPTCEKDGYTTYVCSCGDTYVGNIVAATGHSYTASVTAPTCTEKGYTTHTCDCGDSYVDNYVNAKGHTPGEWEVIEAPTHESIGYKLKSCDTCDALLLAEKLGATGHSYTASDIAPTCTEKGYTTHTCDCGDSYTDSFIDALGHKFEDGVCVRCDAENPTADEALTNTETALIAAGSTATVSVGGFSLLWFILKRRRIK